MSRAVAMMLGLAALAGCGPLADLGLARRSETPAVAAPPSPELVAPPPVAGARTAEALDTTTPEQRAAATAQPAPSGSAPLGSLIVALGNVTEPGFWLRSALVSAPAPGLVKAADGRTVQVDLLPGEGGAQLSLAAFRALGLVLTDLPEVTVYRR